MTTRRRATPASFNSPNGVSVINGYRDLPTTVVPAERAESGWIPSGSDTVVVIIQIGVSLLLTTSDTTAATTTDDEKLHHRDGRGKPYRPSRLRGMIILFLVNLTVILIFWCCVNRNEI
jgi:hypothetical protein